MKKSGVLLVLMFLAVNFLSAQTTWEKLFSKISTDGFRSVQEVPSGGYIVAGYTADSSVNDTDAFVVRMNISGDTIWTFNYNGPLSKRDVFYKVINTTDGGFLASGFTNSVTGLSDDMLYVKLSSSGQIQWVQTYGGTERERAQDLVETIDGYTLVGYTLSPPAQYYDVLVVHIDFSGTVLWTKVIGDSGYDDANTVLKLADGGYLLGGQSNSVNNNYDYFIVRLNSIGDTLWTKHFGGLSTDNIESVIAVTGGYVFAGSANSPVTGDDGYMFKTDTSGNVLWSQTFGGTMPDDFHRVSATSDGGYVLSGTTSSSGPIDPNMWLVKTDSNGDTLWTRTFGADNHDHGYSAIQTSDGGYVICGFSSSFGFNESDAYIVKVDANGNKSNPFIYISAVDLTSPLCSGTSSMVKAIIRNYSHDAILNPTFTMQVSGGVTQTLTGTYLGLFNPHDLDTVLFSPLINTSSGGSFTFYCYSNLANDVFPQRSSFTKTVNLLPCVGIDEVEAQLGFSVYPNPAGAEFSVSFSENYRDVHLELVNSIGKILKSKNFSNTNGLTETVNLKGVANGIYLLKVSTEGRYSVKKLVIQ